VQGLINVQIIQDRRSDRLLKLSGRVDSDTQTAIVEFQRRHGIERNGDIEPRDKTFKALLRFRGPSGMRASQRGIELIKKYEKLPDHPYDRDGGGNTTIGFGHLIHRGMIDHGTSEQRFEHGVTHFEAERILRDDLRTAERDIDAHVRVPLTQNQFDALASLVFNIGPQFDGSTLLRLLNLGDYFEAADRFAEWHYSRGNPLSDCRLGGVRRRGCSDSDKELLPPHVLQNEVISVSFTHAKASGKAPLAALAMVLLAATTSATALADDCRRPTDFGEAQRCFLRQFPCILAYFGIDQPRDYPKALTCFKHENDWAFVVVMYLNGEGTSQDLQKAESVLMAGEKNNPDAFSGNQRPTLEAAIHACRQNTHKSCPHIDYCKDLADSTFDMEVCDAVAQVSEEAKFGRTIAGVKTTLSASNRATFERAVAEFKAYQLAEMQRASDAAIPGTLSGLARAGQAAFVRENFTKLIAETSAPCKLKPASPEAYLAANAHLWRVYGEDIARMLHQRREIVKEYRWVITDYRKAAQESQRRWLRLRDLLGKLAASRSRNPMGGCDPAVAEKFAVTTTRLVELRNNQIGPSNHQDRTSAAPQLSP
jgi:lysozyme